MLQEQRKKNGLTQKELAEKLQVSIRTIQSYEQGTRNIKNIGIEKLEKIAKVLKCTIAEIIEK